MQNVKFVIRSRRVDLVERQIGLLKVYFVVCWCSATSQHTTDCIRRSNSIRISLGSTGLPDTLVANRWNCHLRPDVAGTNVSQPGWYWWLGRCGRSGGLRLRADSRTTRHVGRHGTNRSAVCSDWQSDGATARYELCWIIPFLYICVGPAAYYYKKRLKRSKRSLAPIASMTMIVYWAAVWCIILCC